MAKTKIKFKLTRSGLERIQDKYTATVLSNGSSNLSMLAQDISEDRPAIDEAEVTLVTNALASAIARYVRLNYKVSTPIGLFEPGIEGSVPSMDAPVSAENQLVVQFTENASVTAQFSAIKPVNDTENVGIRIDDIEDAATHGKVIKGTGEFIVTGFNISAKQTGESLALVAADGSVLSQCTLVGDDDGLGQRIRARLATAVPAGTYRLRLVTHGYGTPAAEVQTLLKKVEVIAA